MKQIQEQKQEQAQKQRQVQSYSQQQLLQASLIELPVAQLIDRIQAEKDANPALEDGYATDGEAEKGNAFDINDGDDFEATAEREERQSALDEALSRIGGDDEDLPVYIGGRNTSEEQEEIVYGNTITFYDKLKEQMLEFDLDDVQKEILEYIIGSLDDDGWLRKPLESIADELACYKYIDVSVEELEKVLSILHEFDPAGIGARSLQECLLLQIERRDESNLKRLMERVVTEFFDEFTKKHWDKICAALNLSEAQAKALYGELRKLTPKPGCAMGESVGRSLQQITPDFIVETSDDGHVTFYLNQGDLPELQVSQSFADSIAEYQKNGENMSRQVKEALLYTKKKVAAAQSFIEAIKVRRHTLTVTMKAIIGWQRAFFEDGDEASLRPMRLKDIAEKTGLDISTVSRVSSGKYAQTPWGTFRLKHFFTESYVTESGEEMSTRKIKAALRDIIDAENKKKPLSDDALKEELKKMGFPIARRTVTKYREQMGQPVARLRKQ